MSYSDYNENLSNVQVSVVDASIQTKVDASNEVSTNLRTRLMGDTLSALSSIFATTGMPAGDATSSQHASNANDMHAGTHRVISNRASDDGAAQPPAGPNAHTRGLVSVWASFLCFLVFGVLYVFFNYKASRKRKQTDVAEVANPSALSNNQDDPVTSSARLRPTSIRGQRDSFLTSNDLLAQVRPHRTGPSSAIVGRAESDTTASVNAPAHHRPISKLAVVWTTVSGWSWVTIFGLATIASFLWFLASLVWFSSSANSNLDAMASSAGERMVRVEANGRVHAFPDRIILQICETTTRQPVTNAAASAEALRLRVSDLVSQLRTRVHVPSSDIHLQAVGTHPIYAPRSAMTYGGFDYIVPVLQTSATQYVSTQTVLVDTMFVPDRINSLLEVLSVADVNFTMSFQLSESSQQLQQGLAVDAATRHAADLAAHVAESAEVVLGPVISIDVVRSGGFPSIQPITLVSTTMQGSDISMILDPLTQSKVIVSAQVVARYSLRE